MNDRQMKMLTFTNNQRNANQNYSEMNPTGLKELENRDPPNKVKNVGSLQASGTEWAWETKWLLLSLSKIKHVHTPGPASPLPALHPLVPDRTGRRRTVLPSSGWQPGVGGDLVVHYEENG